MAYSGLLIFSPPVLLRYCDMQYHISLWYTKYDFCVHCEMITTINLVNIHGFIQLQTFLPVIRTLRSTLLVTFKHNTVLLTIVTL